MMTALPAHESPRMPAPRPTTLAEQIRESAATLAALADHEAVLRSIVDHFASCLDAGGTLYLCGNGGSAADAQHVAAEFVGRFLRERRAHVTDRDCVIGISTSGRSPNVLRALEAAREIGAATIGFTGANGRDLAGICDACLIVPSTNTPRIQESHLLAWHLVCDEVERRIAGVGVEH
jgi:D-sedoheptulose 7-phosphate isomerase